MITLETFIEFLNTYDLAFKENAKSVILPLCPHCGSRKWKIFFSKYRDDESQPFLGKCYKCNTRYSSISYLLALEIDRLEVLRLHSIKKALADDTELELGDEYRFDNDTNKDEDGDKTLQDIRKSFSDFVPIKYWLHHPVAKYAIKRGLPEELYDKVFIDWKWGSVVFPCFSQEDGSLVGYQRRLLQITRPEQKALSSYGFQKSQHVIEYPNPNKDILVCEGPFTGISGYHYGFHSIVTFGSGISLQQLAIIAKKAKQYGVKVAIGYDNDIAGLLGYIRIFNSMQRNGIPVYRVLPEVGNDLNDSWIAKKSYIIENTNDFDPSIPFIDPMALEDGTDSPELSLALENIF